MTRLKMISIVILASLTSLAQASEFDALINAKKYAEAEKLANLRIAADPSHADALIAKVRVILAEARQDKFDEAVKLSELCIAKHPQNSECHEANGNILAAKAQRSSVFTAMGLAGKIKEAYLHAVELNPKNYSARGSLMQFYLIAPAVAGGGKDKAEALVSDTQKYSPSAASLLQCSLDLKEEKLSKAETAATQVAVAGADDLMRLQRNVMFAIGQTYLGKKSYTDAERVFQELMQKYPDKYQGSFGLGRTYQEQGKHKEALLALEKSLSLDNSATINYRVAQSLLALNEKSRALQFYEKSLQLVPTLSTKFKEDAQLQIKQLRS